MKPDYSKIEPMACKCKDIRERDEILRQMKEWGVPIDFKRWGFEEKELLWLITFEDDNNNFREVMKNSDGGSSNETILSPSDFLSKFREVYDKWRSTEGLVHIEKYPVTESNPKESGYYLTDRDYKIKYDGITCVWLSTVQPHFWYSEVTERLYTADEIHEVIRNGFYSDSFQEFISQLNKDKDK